MSWACTVYVQAGRKGVERGDDCLDFTTKKGRFHGCALGRYVLYFDFALKIRLREWFLLVCKTTALSGPNRPELPGSIVDVRHERVCPVMSL